MAHREALRLTALLIIACSLLGGCAGGTSSGVDSLIAPAGTTAQQDSLPVPEGYRSKAWGTVAVKSLEVRLGGNESFSEAYLVLVSHTATCDETGHPVNVSFEFSNPAKALRGGSAPLRLIPGRPEQGARSGCEGTAGRTYLGFHEAVTGTYAEMAGKSLYPRILTTQELIATGKIDSGGALVIDKAGDSRTFTIYNLVTNEVREKPCTCRHVGERCYVYMDNDDASCYSDMKSYASQVAGYFDSTVSPLVHQHIGTEWSPGIDGDPRVYLVFSRDKGTANICPFDYYPRAELSVSNQCEAVYFNPVLFDATRPAEETFSDMKPTLGHEFTHLVRFSMKFLIPPGGAEKWADFSARYPQDRGIDEGTAIFTENILLQGGISSNSTKLSPARASQLDDYLSATELYPPFSYSLCNAKDPVPPKFMYYAPGMTITDFLYEKDGFEAIARLNQNDGTVGLSSCRAASSAFDSLYDRLALSYALSGETADPAYTIQSFDLSGKTDYQGVKLHNVRSFITNCGDYGKGIDVGLLSSPSLVPAMKLYEWAPAYVRFFNGGGQRLTVTMNILDTQPAAGSEMRGYFFYTPEHK
ncbi:MAG: hypothetical protein RDV48_19325 [Candidatus Eremiobacteraeota bacterium]|nr:hypothetical protein [Candidatus Eremiobacteraeota bacterium]